MTQQEDWREPARAAVLGQVVDFDRYVPIDLADVDTYADVCAPGAIDVALAGAVARHTQDATGVEMPPGVFIQVQRHLNAALRNIAQGAQMDAGYRGLLEAYRGTLPRADLVCSLCQEAHEPLEDCGA